MERKRRSQADRSAATTAALVEAARRLWSERGYAAVGTPEIAAAAGVTRGALYHQFADKAALFGEVAEAVESDVTARLGEYVAASGARDPAAALHAAVDGWLEACEEPEVRRILLLDGPAVLGWDGFRDMALRHGLGLTEAMLKAAIDAGQLPPQPTRPLAHVVIGALDEAAMYVATADDRAAARSEVARSLHALLDGLLGESG
jgi:AcrR family transcriptional regulator